MEIFKKNKKHNNFNGLKKFDSSHQMRHLLFVSETHPPTQGDEKRKSELKERDHDIPDNRH